MFRVSFVVAIALAFSNPAHAEEMFAAAEVDAKRRMNFYKAMGEIM